MDSPVKRPTFLPGRERLMRKKMAGEFVTVWIPSNRKADLMDYVARLAAPLAPAPRATKAPRQIDIEDAIRATGKPRKKASA